MPLLKSRLTRDGVYFISGNIDENTSQVPLGSMSFDGTTQQFMYAGPSVDFSIGLNDFTIEWFQYALPGGGSFPRVFSMGNAPPYFEVSEESGTFFCWFANGGSPGAFAMDPIFNKWVWMAVSRIGGVLHLFQDGELKYRNNDSSDLSNSSGNFVVGLQAISPGITQYKGLITSFRLINGDGLYSGVSVGHTYYSVPTSPLVSTGNTKLLLLAESSDQMAIDSSGIGRIIINSVGVSWDANSPFKASGIKTSIDTSYADEFDEVTLTISPDGSNITSSGLLLNLDSGNPSSYPGSGSTWTDLSGNGNNFTLQNNPVFSNEDGGILTFSAGSGQYANGPDFGSLSNFTAEGWIRFHSLPNFGAVPAIITNIYSGGNYLNFALSFIGSDFNGGIFTGGVWYNTTGITPLLNSWYDFAMTYDGTTLKFYINGILFSSLSVSQPAVSTGLGYYIARRWDNPDYIDGDIPVVRVYNRALTAEEILINFDAISSRYINIVKRETSTGAVQVSNYFDEVSLMTIDPNLIMYLDAKEYLSYPGTGNFWYDLSGNKNDVYMVNPGGLSWNSDGYFINFSNGYFIKPSANDAPLGNSSYCMGVWCRENNPWPGGSGLIGIGDSGNVDHSNFLRTNSLEGTFLNYWWGNDLACSSSVLVGEWCLVLAQFDGTTRSIWVNGVMVASDNPGPDHNVDVDTIYVGNTAYFGDQTNQGNIATAFMYNRSLSSDEIITMFNTQRGRFGV